MTDAERRAAQEEINEMKRALQQKERARDDTQRQLDNQREQNVRLGASVSGQDQAAFRFSHNPGEI